MRPRAQQQIDYRAHPILYVDDEADNLRIFELTFRRNFSILTATSAEEGIRILNENPVAVVLSDQRMPGATGVEFLARVRQMDPQTVRILMTAYGDAEILGSAINDGSIYRYIPKPWEPEDVRLTIQRAMEAYVLERDRSALLSELTLLNQLSRAMHAEIDLDRLIHLLLNALHTQLEFDGASVLFFEKDKLVWRGRVPDDSALSGTLNEVNLSEESAPNFIKGLRAGRAQRLFASSVEESEKPVAQWLNRVSADEILTIPLIGENGVMGALAVDNRRGGEAPQQEDLEMLEGFATQAVIAIENARLVEKLREAQAQVQRADRLGTLGTLAAGLAHEINNPLVSIHTFLSLAPGMRDDQDESFWGEYHSLASAELDRIRSLVATMSQLARGGGSTEGAEASPLDLVKLLEEVVRLLQPKLRSSNLSLQFEVEDEFPEIAGNRSHLHQLFLNLVLNAIHATPEGGTIRLEIQKAEGSPCDEVRVCVRDTGHGIAAEDIDQIFDPFFTTKEPDEGSGLGLMIAHQIVAEHRGLIQVESRQGEGSTFGVRLPISADSPRLDPLA